MMLVLARFRNRSYPIGLTVGRVRQRVTISLTKNKRDGIVMSTTWYKTNPVNNAAPPDVPRCIREKKD
ncbi:hypothetical protein [Methanoregula sp.]|uniref:hypothetical protein n=1 Tax=Methanoregula sp. TaxID=2052170 RepID=UPI003BB04501